MQDFVKLTDALDGHTIAIRFGSIRTMDHVTDPSGRSGTVVSTCGGQGSEYVVAETIEQIFRKMDQNAIAVHGNDYGIATEHAH